MDDEIDRGIEMLKRERERRLTIVKIGSVGFVAVLIGWRVVAAFIRPSASDLKASATDFSDLRPSARTTITAAQRTALSAGAPSCRALVEEADRLNAFALVGDPSLTPSVCSAPEQKRRNELITRAKTECNDSAAVETLGAQIAAACSH